MLMDTEDDKTQVQSFLPSWVIKLREKVSASREVHADAISRLEKIRTSITALDVNLDKIRKDYSSQSGGNIEHQENHLSINKVFVFHLWELPTDIMKEILEYLGVRNIGIFECTCLAVKRVIAENPFWDQLLPLFCPHVLNFRHITIHHENQNFNLSESNIGGVTHARYIIGLHCLTSYHCLQFIIAMKEQRSVRRSSSIEPHRHSKSERGVTHPLPIFQSYYSDGQVSIPAITNSGSSHNHNQRRNSFISDMIMSRAETLNSDVRARAHKSLTALFHLSASSLDPLHFKLAGNIFIIYYYTNICMS